jgi:dephospho-CoA kinase
MKNKKLKIAITGSIGSGKSSFAEFLSSAGYPLLKADDISKEILSSDESIRKKIIKEFGNDSFKNGLPNKSFLAKKVFSDPENVVKINSILHPPVIKRINTEMEKLLKTNSMVLVEAALIYEADMEDMFDYVVLVTSAEEIRQKRKTTLDKLSEDDFKKRSLNQIPDEEKKKRADFIFENNGTLDDLKKKAQLLLMLLDNI